LSTRILSVGRIVAASTRHPLIVLFLVGGLTLAALVYIAQNFAMTADTTQLISQRLEWRQRELAFEAAFPLLFRPALFARSPQSNPALQGLWRPLWSARHSIAYPPSDAAPARANPIN
jgi:hypothetical protein